MLSDKDVLLRPKRSTLKSRSEVDLSRTFHFRHSKREWTGVPFIVANMDTVGTFEMAGEMARHRCMVAVHKHYTVDDWRAFAAQQPDVLPFVATSAGTSKADMAKLDEILTACPGVTTICLDVANGYSEFFVDTVKRVRARWPTHTLIAGNVVTNEMTEELIMHGADIVKVGIGPGSVCTTRKQTGVGYPQLSAVIECADAAHGLGGYVCADGGVTCPGDAAKAFGGGADFIMMGGMFAYAPHQPPPYAPPLLQLPSLACNSSRSDGLPFEQGYRGGGRRDGDSRWRQVQAYAHRTPFCPGPNRVRRR